ncbi:MAG: glycosyltransferase family 1 protein [Deltaproteobacteria bacterium]|nr:glycosyltransferase family 1 protein [Deltaproteobacteria bacterium]
MSVIVMITRGTHGDHFPFLMLGRELKRRGHRVRIGLGKPMQAHARKMGLTCFDCGTGFGAGEALKHADHWNHWALPKTRPEPVRAAPDIPAEYQGLRTAGKTAHILVCSSIFSMGGLVHMATGIPWVTLCLSPAQICEAVRQDDPLTEDDTARKLRVMLENRRIHLHKYLRTVGKYFGLRELPLAPEELEELQFSENLILGTSPHFATPVDKYAHARASGFIFHEDPDWPRWRPDKNLEAFLSQDPPPLVLSYSSLPLENPDRVLAVHARAAQKLGRPLLVQKGWAGFNTAHIPDDVDKNRVMVAGFMPHDPLFSRADAVIHHGGTGTTGRALKNGCPVLVEPYGNDQFYNAKRVLELQVGAAMHPLKLTAKELAAVLEKKVLTDRYKDNAKGLKEKLSGENGINTACDIIEAAA